MSSQVHIGTWRDYSQPNAFEQYTLTLSSQWGNLLISALVLLVNLAGSAIWSMAAFGLHQWRSSADPIDGFDMQLQTLLRNKPSHLVMLWELACLWSTWRKRRTQVGRRIFMLALWPATIAGGAAAASLFVVKTAFTAEKLNSVLKTSGNCGFVNATSGLYTVAQAQSAKIANDTRVASARVDTCSISSGHDCIGLPIQQLNFTSSRVPCPFAGAGRCVTPALRLASDYINSNAHLGINAPQADQVEMRMVQTCAVVTTRDVVTRLPDTSVRGNATEIVLINLGPTTVNTNFTFSYPSRYVNGSLTYTIQSVYNVAGDVGNAIWLPSPQVDVNFADVTLHAISANSVKYVYAVLDPMFLANGTESTTLRDGTVVYNPNYYVSVTACTEQFEYRNPQTNASTALSGYLQTQTRIANIGLNNAQLATALRIHNAAYAARNINVVSGQGVNALQATKQLYYFTSSRLPDNQHEIEYTHWFRTGLASLQYRVVDYPDNLWYTPDSEALTGLFVRAASTFPEETSGPLKDQCKTQRIQSTGAYVNFYFAAVLIVIIASCLLVIADWVLPYGISKLPSRRPARPALSEDDGRPERAAGDKRYKYLRWVADHKYNLARAAVGGEWVDGNTTSPYQVKFGEQSQLVSPPVETEGSIDYPQVKLFRELLQLDEDTD